MSVSIKFEDREAREFEKLKDEISGVETNIGLVRKLMSFYKSHSPYLRVGKGHKASSERKNL